MRHPGEEELILYYYGEHPAAAEVEAHLGGCPACRSEYEGLVAALAAVDAEPLPERGEGYGGEVWARLQPRLAPAARRPFRVWAAAAAVAAMVLLAVLAGRVGPRSQPAQEASWEQVRERILLAEVGQHLERAELVLTEAAHGNPLDELARDLVESNRLYRQTAALAGENAVAAFLEDLERVLLELEHGSADQRALALDDMVFKVRVTATQVRARELEADRAKGRS
jgi:hypothetical protein